MMAASLWTNAASSCFQLDVNIQRAVQQTRSAASAAIFLDGVRRRFLDLGVRDQIEIIVRPEHQHFALAHADFARSAAFAVAKDLEVHVQSSGLQITRTSEGYGISRKCRWIALPFFFAGDVASRYAHGP